MGEGAGAAGAEQNFRSLACRTPEKEDGKEGCVGSFELQC